jgi:signal transduction histidine kinase
LAVDDDVNFLELLCTSLQDAGYEVASARTGEQCLERVPDFHPDCVVLDSRLPGLDGEDVCRRLKTEFGPTFLPVLLLSAYSATSDVVRALQEGFADEYVSKPVAFPELHARIDTLIRIKDVHRRLERANAELRVMDSMKTEFVSNVSHELRTPLTSIHQSVDLLLAEEAGPLNEDQRRFLSIIDEEVQRLGRLIDDVLDFSRMEAERLRLKTAPVHIGSLVDHVLNVVRTRAREMSIGIETSIPEDLPEVDADRDRLIQVLMNLLGNAMKHTPAGGRIGVACEARSDDPDRDDCVRVCVWDTGRGVAQTDFGRIFAPFEQSSMSTRDREPGTGLGLAITKGIVEAHGGRIWVESDGTNGCRFIFELPRDGRSVEADANLLGELLVRDGYLDANQLAWALKEQGRSGELLGEVLVRSDLIEIGDLKRVLRTKRSARANGGRGPGAGGTHE